MEAAGHRRHWIKTRISFLRIALLLCVSLAAITHAQAEAPKCNEGDEFLSKNQICCNKCSPGYKLVAECPGPSHRSTCAPCPYGQYIDKINYSPNCLSCRRCNEKFFEVVASSCERNKNTICRCKDGYYKSKIDSRKFECSRCTVCGANERETQNCSPENDRVCGCKDNYYRAKNKCLPCTNCTEECQHHCPKIRLDTGNPSDTSPQLINLIAGVGAAVLVALVLVIIITNIATKRQTKRKLQKKLSQQCEQPAEMYKQLTDHIEEPSDHCLHSVPEHHVIIQEPSNLPDCVPLEIKSAEVIYTVLDLVPVKQVKQLVRSLGVTDAVIEHAELDHRSSREAHYQMLRSWAEKGTAVCMGGQVLHRPLLQELLDKLRQMHLEQTAEELETKYNLM